MTEDFGKARTVNVQMKPPIMSPKSPRTPTQLAPKWPQESTLSPKLKRNESCDRLFTFSVSSRSSKDSSPRPMSAHANLNMMMKQSKETNNPTRINRSGEPCNQPKIIRTRVNGAATSVASEHKMNSHQQFNSGISLVQQNPTPEPADTGPTKCGKCNNVISGKFFTAMAKDWHPECFKCQVTDCDARLEAVGYIENEGMPYCKKCYEAEIAYSCSKCGLKIIGDIMHALNQTWHLKCFCCCICGIPFNDGIFHFVNEKPYCPNCAPGGPFDGSTDAGDTCSLDETCSLFTADFTTESFLDGFNDRPISMMSYRSSIPDQSRFKVPELAEKSRMAHFKNRWAKINEISKDYEKHAGLSKFKYYNPLRYQH